MWESCKYQELSETCDAYFLNLVLVFIWDLIALFPRWNGSIGRDKYHRFIMTIDSAKNIIFLFQIHFFILGICSYVGVSVCAGDGGCQNYHFPWHYSWAAKTVIRPSAREAILLITSPLLQILFFLSMVQNTQQCPWGTMRFGRLRCALTWS